MNSYQIFLQGHSGVRWLILLLALITIIKSAAGLFGNGEYKKLDNILSASFVGLMHLQFVLGLVLYFFLSPWTTQAFQDFGAAMKDANLRFWAVEHLLLMILAVASVQIGRSKSKKSAAAKKKFKFQLIFFTIGLVLLVLGIPWDRV